MKRTFIGSVYTDVASLLIADPCRVLRSEDSDTPSYEDLMAKVFPDSAFVPENNVVAFADGLYIRGDFDGYYHVWLEENGDTRRLTIDLVAWVKPTPEETS